MRIIGSQSADRFDSGVTTLGLIAEYHIPATATYWQILSADTPQDVHLPSGVAPGWSIYIVNKGTAILTVWRSDGTLAIQIKPGEGWHVINAT